MGRIIHRSWKLESEFSDEDVEVAARQDGDAFCSKCGEDIPPNVLAVTLGLTDQRIWLCRDCVQELADAAG